MYDFNLVNSEFEYAKEDVDTYISDRMSGVLSDSELKDLYILKRATLTMENLLLTTQNELLRKMVEEKEK